MSNNSNNQSVFLNGSENDISVQHLLSPKYAIRGALGNLGMGHFIQNLEEDMIRWSGEANEKIIQNTKAATIYKPVSQIAYTKNNRIKLCDGFQSLQCLKLNGCQIPFAYNKSRCTTTCSNGESGVSNCGCGSCLNVVTPVIQNCHSFYLDGCWVKFSPVVDDGWKVEIEAWATPKDEDGYVLVVDTNITAIQDYIAWMICRREGDSRMAMFEKNWYFNCRQARAILNDKTDAELREISKWWQPRGFFIARGFGNGSVW
jgi:hypothetical protein